MRKTVFFHPVTIFISSLIALGVSLYLYIDSYLRVNETLKTFIQKSGLPKEQFRSPETWIMILTLSVLVSLIIIGMVVIFTYYQKVIQLYRMQQSFINGFTHELKTPIASLRIFIDTFKKHELTREKQLDYLDLMGRDTERLQSNVMQILNMAKIEDRSFKPNFSKINLGDYINNFLEKNSYLFPDVDFQLSLNNDSLIEADSELIDVVLMNIIVNGVSYNESNKKIITITLEEERSGHLLVIKDNGIGVKSEYLKDIFKKFYQVGKSAKGSGIGLYMVSQIMKLHRGKVSAKSDENNNGTHMCLQFKRG